MGSVVFALVLAATPAQVLLTPVSYSRGVFVRSNGTAVAAVLVVRTTAVDAESLGEEESRKWQQLGLPGSVTSTRPPTSGNGQR